MAEYERKGHWREMPDGTRTWVSPHNVVREKKPVTKPYEDISLENLKSRVSKPNKRKRKRKKSRKSAEEISITRGSHVAASMLKTKALKKIKPRRKILVFRNF